MSAVRIEELETVLRSLISCGGTSQTIKAMAMNALATGSGDAWLAARDRCEYYIGPEGERCSRPMPCREHA